MTIRRYELLLKEHATKDSLEKALKPISYALDHLPLGFKGCLLVDASMMTGYDVEARAYFVEWNSKYRVRLHAVAIVTEKTLWHMVIAAIGVAARQTMKAFYSLDEAQKWLDSFP